MKSECLLWILALRDIKVLEGTDDVKRTKLKNLYYAGKTRCNTTNNTTTRYNKNDVLLLYQILAYSTPSFRKLKASYSSIFLFVILRCRKKG